MDILKWVLLGILALFGIYVLARLVTAAVMRSYYDAKKRARKEAKNNDTIRSSKNGRGFISRPPGSTDAP